MNVLFVPSIGLDVSLLERLAASVDYPVKYKVALNNGPTGALESFRETHLDWTVLEPKVGNRGVAGSWNDCAKMLPNELAWLLMNEDAWFLPGYLEQIAKTIDANLDAPIIHLNDSNAFYCFGHTAAGIRQFGTFDENFWPAYCLAPETPILKDDLTWVRLDSLNIGDGLLAVEEYPSRTAGRNYVQSEVLELKRRITQCAKITFEDGRDVICSLDHKWLTKFPSDHGSRGILWRWKQAREMRPGWRVYSPLRTWKPDHSFDAGWLSGVFDGEGSFHCSTRMRGICFSQKKGAVLDKALNILREMDIHFTTYDTAPDGVVSVDIAVKRDSLELLGKLRPVRLMPNHKRLWNGHQVRSKHIQSNLEVTKIELIGDSEVITMETSSRTFIANGLVSHNCEDNDMRIRHRLKGITSHPYALQGLPPLPHGKTRSGGVNYEALIQGCGLLNRAYWRRKWGSENREGAGYSTPYKDHRLGVNEWVWYPEHRAKLYPLWEAFISQPNPSIYD